jgi:hypothetical protein
MAELTITTFYRSTGSCRPSPDEDPSGNFPYGGWLVPHADADIGKFMTDIFTNADAFLLGRTTYDIFAEY